MPSKPELRQAMWSVYQHAFFRPGLRASVLPETVRPISLVQALDVLLASSDAHDYSRRERALRKLAAAGLTDRRRLARLAGAELAADILARVETLAQLVGVDVVLLDAQKFPDLITFFDANANTRASMGKCAIKQARSVACYDGTSLNTKVTASALVNRPLADLATVLDPNRWDDCSDAFVETHKTVDTAPPYAADPNSPPPGTAWGGPWGPGIPPPGMLLEEVNVGPASFKNVLNINFTVNLPVEIRVDYGLNDSVDATIVGISFPGGALEIDDGFLSAKPALDPSWTEITVEKTVRFSDLSPGTAGGIDFGQLLNYSAPGIVCLWLDDATQMGPCCDQNT